MYLKFKYIFKYTNFEQKANKIVCHYFNNHKLSILYDSKVNK